jgi:hypothetical protein
MMFEIKPKRKGVIDAMTGAIMPMSGVIRDVVLPPDYAQERRGDVSIEFKTQKTKGVGKDANSI